jgi:hypothetical protein
MNSNTNWPAIEKAASDLKVELIEYRQQLSTRDPVLSQYRQRILKINLKSGKIVRLPAEVLPPAFKNNIPPAFFEHAASLNLEDADAIIDDFWNYYKQTTPGWMGQASSLPSR